MSESKGSRRLGAGLSPERQRLLAKLLAAKGVKPAAAGGASDAIPRRTGDGPAPCTFAQEALWFLDQLEPDTSLHNQPGAVRLSGPLDVAALEAALDGILRRHEALRTTFVEVDGAPKQVVAPHEPYTLPVTDLTADGGVSPAATGPTGGAPGDADAERADTSRARVEAEALRLATEAAGAPFDLERGPLHRMLLLKLAPDEHVLVVTFHHIVTDGWSMAVFTKELRALYGAAVAGRAGGTSASTGAAGRPGAAASGAGAAPTGAIPDPLPPLAVQMADFAAWQREHFTGARLEEQLAYWREHLAGNPQGLELPGDRPRPAVRTFRGGHQLVDVPADLSDRLRALSREQGVTLFMTLEAAFLVLLHAETGVQDALIGSAVAHRNREELEPLIGFLVNMLVLRTDLSGDPPFTELLARVRPAVLGAWSHQDLPLTRIINEVQPERDIGRNPLFQIQFSLLTPDVNPAVYGYGLDTGDIETIELPGGVAMTPWHVPFDNARYDLAVFLWDMPQGIRGTMEYARDLYDASTMERLAGRYGRLLAAVAAHPRARLSKLVAGLREEEQRARAAAEQTYEQSMKASLKSLRRRRRPGSSP